MKQKFAKICMIFLLIFLTDCVQNSDKNFSKVLIDNGHADVVVDAEIADDNNERAKGLMFVESLGENAGMLFVFEREDFQTFWMKNTLIPLDMIFIDEELNIVDIKNALPCAKDPCQLYKPDAPAKYVLEVNGNFTKKNGIRPGNRVRIQNKANQ